MPAEDHKNMKKVQCWIPLDTWDKIVSLGYNSPTIAVTEAFKKLLEDPQEDPRTNPLVSLKDPLESPEIPVYQARIEGLEMILKEKDRSIERLENDLNKAGQREEDLKQMHNNYFLQVQTLINQKAIGSPAQEKSQQAQTESNLSSIDGNKNSKESSAPAQEKKHTLETACLNCGELFTAERSTRKFCSGKCKAAYYRKQKNSGLP